eukprot:scaffold7068_cov301-Pinguiococcus_pyrenoidosus.AAC.16
MVCLVLRMSCDTRLIDAFETNPLQLPVHALPTPQDFFVDTPAAALVKLKPLYDLAMPQPAVYDAPPCEPRFPSRQLDGLLIAHRGYASTKRSSLQRRHDFSRRCHAETVVKFQRWIQSGADQIGRKGRHTGRERRREISSAAFPRAPITQGFAAISKHKTAAAAYSVSNDF